MTAENKDCLPKYRITFMELRGYSAIIEADDPDKAVASPRNHFEEL